MPVIKDVTVSEMCVEDLGGDTCLTAVVDVTEDGLPSRYYAAIAEDYDNLLCVKRIPFGALCCSNYGFAPWDIVPDSVVEAIRNAGIEKKLLKICKEGYCAKGDKSRADEDEYPNKFPWTGDDFYDCRGGDSYIRHEGNEYTGIFSYVDRGVEYLFGEVFPSQEISYIMQRNV